MDNIPDIPISDYFLQHIVIRLITVPHDKQIINWSCNPLQEIRGVSRKTHEVLS